MFGMFAKGAHLEGYLGAKSKERLSVRLLLSQASPERIRVRSTTSLRRVQQEVQGGRHWVARVPK